MDCRKTSYPGVYYFSTDTRTPLPQRHSAGIEIGKTKTGHTTSDCIELFSDDILGDDSLLFPRATRISKVA